MLVDVFDALTSVRPYKAAWEIDRAVQLLHDESGKHFDPEVVAHFVRHLPEILDNRERWADH
ncbi:MAG: hypothetical protein CFE46_09620 [Burkholderiales bacterium PBB6]|nr:MAG: hypothetical protein CFE46_09620 [Burkholderiales bacterium PBB6]